MSPPDNEELVRRVVERIWNAAELDLADELFGPDHVNRNGLIPDLVRGPEAIKISVTLYRLAFPALHLSIDELSSDWDTVLLRWTAWRRPPRTPAGGAVNEGLRLLTGTTTCLIADGKVVESRTLWDRAALLDR